MMKLFVLCVLVLASASADEATNGAGSGFVERSEKLRQFLGKHMKNFDVEKMVNLHPSRAADTAADSQVDLLQEPTPECTAGINAFTDAIDALDGSSCAEIPSNLAVDTTGEDIAQLEAFCDAFDGLCRELFQELTLTGADLLDACYDTQDVDALFVVITGVSTVITNLMIEVLCLEVDGELCIRTYGDFAVSHTPGAIDDTCPEEIPIDGQCDSACDSVVEDAIDELGCCLTGTFAATQAAAALLSGESATFDAQVCGHSLDVCSDLAEVFSDLKGFSLESSTAPVVPTVLVVTMLVSILTFLNL